MVEGSAVNVEAVLEEYEIGSKMYTLPPRDGRVYCYVPLDEFSDDDLIEVLRAPVKVLVSTLGASGLMVFSYGPRL